MDETIRTSQCLSQKIIRHIGPHPLLVSGLLSSHIYGTYCNVYTIQCMHYSMYLIGDSSVNQKKAKGEDPCERLFCDLGIGWF